MVEGLLAPGDKVLLVDDIVTSGKNILDASRTLRAEGELLKMHWSWSIGKREDVNIFSRQG